ncbi:ABC transporter substrate-binding protein [Domibacillus antri]|uniref:ABC transporter substrate-binding protein n=1 Tax=Domibacillus antri TaxID=1714264 RepID=A0A1Q8Q464_9BACI|nr:ABC transporter substrate-binding protein [Domibacillus antri]OLN22117.1 ABC transporter substrate-binding protein [Domibacillus antri]
MNKKWFVILVSACLFFLAACGNSAMQSTSNSDDKADASGSSSETIKIGALLPSSGVYASLGKNLSQGMELYFDEINWEVEGKKIEIINEDSEADPQVSLRKARKMIDQDQVDILTGTVSTAVAYAIRDEVDSKKIPFLVSHAGGNDLTRSQRSDYIWRSSFSSWQIGHSMGEWAYKNVGHKIYVTAADYAFGKEVSAAFKEAYTAAGGEIVGEVYPPLGNNDYSSYLTTIGGAEADAVYAFFAGSDAVRFVQQYEQYGLKEKMPLIGSGWLVSEDLRESQGNAPEGILASTFWDYNINTDENKAFTAAFEKKYGARPTLEALEGYDAARIIAEAAASLGGDVSDPDQVVEAFSNVTFASPRGEFKFDKDTHHVIQDMYITKTQLVNGKTENEVIETIEQVQDPGK